jgi:hypothetical protein
VSDETDETEELGRLLAELPPAREHHYAFAHMALPEVVFHGKSSPDLATLAADVGLFRELWSLVGERVQGPRLSDDGLQTHYLQDAELDALVVVLPAPQCVAEAFMVAISRRRTRRWLVFPKTELRYFTLERGVSLSDDGALGSRTVIGEWTAEPRHLNYGDGPPAAVEAFAAAVFERWRIG